MYTIRYINPINNPDWLSLLNRYSSNIFHSPAWLQVLQETYNMEIGAYVLIDEDERVVAGMPITRICDMRGERLVSMPFCDYYDPLVETQEQWDLLSEMLASEHLPVTMRLLHNELPLHDPRFSEVKVAKWHRIDLRPELPALWDRFEPSVHRAIHKAEKNGVSVRVAEDHSDLRHFFDMHLHIRKYKYHLVAQPYRFFEQIWKHLIEPGKGMLLMAYHGDTLLGATMFLVWGNTIYYKFNASNMDTLEYRSNDFLVWKAIQWAKAQGLTGLDFGLSDWDQKGLCHFKRKFNAEEKTIHFMSFMNGSSPTPWTQPYNQMLSQLTQLFTTASTPDSVTESGGEILYRFFI